ncbi:unnamed protein product [Pleuronectes platessa]|uniref:Uncharacterized protein n=1 Tax=Pleuronectes platessa TaxID=8262 RepID=A0A9N7UXX5_PLEPL|nr:unnamed protein product [Pleuronectes platessa]
MAAPSGYSCWTLLEMVSSAARTSLPVNSLNFSGPRRKRRERRAVDFRSDNAASTEFSTNTRGLDCTDTHHTCTPPTRGHVGSSVLLNGTLQKTAAVFWKRTNNHLVPNSRSRISAAGNAAGHLHDKRDICAGERGPDEAAGGHEPGGPLSRCPRPGPVNNGEGRRVRVTGGAGGETQDFTSVPSDMKIEGSRLQDEATERSLARSFFSVLFAEDLRLQGRFLSAPVVVHGDEVHTSSLLLHISGFDTHVHQRGRQRMHLLQQPQKFNLPQPMMVNTSSMESLPTSSMESIPTSSTASDSETPHTCT